MGGAEEPLFLPTAPEGVGSQKHRNLRRTLCHLSVQLGSALSVAHEKEVQRAKTLGQCWLLAPPALSIFPGLFLSDFIWCEAGQEMGLGLEPGTLLI